MSKRLLAVMLMIFAVATMAFGQGSTVKTALLGSQTAGKSAPVPSGKVAIIDSRAFGDGIGEMKKQLDKLELEFKPRFNDLEALQNQLLQLQEDMKKISDQKA